ncbi:hypothetical protein [Paenibacillus larvae]|uniref:Uncharacterized protein n=1 Tax=Paenibacillus larvae subsp. larvae TaxID=147375 RepID=A0A6C0R0A0_9BACL|nr:hypothetical protein [Paenibacillus larvae]QHZ54170.1 hypothetical protein ERICV_05187 [Paenibacillus larvae subsp. larvae]
MASIFKQILTVMFAIGICVVIFIMGSMLFMYRQLEDSLYLVNSATYTAIDLETIRDKNTLAFKDKAKAELMFRQALQNTFSLDDQLKPTSASSAAIAGPIHIKTLTLKNENETAMLGGVQINKNPAVYSEIQVPIKLPGVPKTFISNVKMLTLIGTSY